VRSAARIEVVRRDGRDVLVDVRSEPPVAVRRTPGRVLLVSSAAAPLPGDELGLELVVGAGASLAVGTAAATILWPPPPECEPPSERSAAPRERRSHSEQHVTARVGEGGRLEWRPEPTISVVGSRHRVRFDVELAATASLALVEELVLGRTGERSGDVELTTRIVRGGTTLVHHAERFGPSTPGWGSAALVGGARHVVSAVFVGGVVGVDDAGDGGAPMTVVEASGSAAWLPVAADAAVLLAVGPDRPTTLALAQRVRPPVALVL
jgi:urease accessory protein